MPLTCFASENIETQVFDALASLRSGSKPVTRTCSCPVYQTPFLLRARPLRGPKRGLLRHIPNKILAQLWAAGVWGQGRP